MPKLFEPIRLRELTLPNRVVIAPMCQYSAIDGLMQPWHAVHLGQLAMADAGLLIIEATGVEPIGRITPGCVALCDDRTEAAIAGVMETVRGLDPGRRAPIGIQLGHAGRKASSHAPWQTGQQIPIAKGGWQAVGPSAIPHIEGEEPPTALTVDDLGRLIDRFADATRRAERLGLDALEMHAAHGYLLHQFLSPVANRRTDEFGGSLENRMRFPLAVLAAMRAAWPAAKPLGVRFSGTDWDADSSWDIEEAAVFAQRCEALGADWIDVSSGGVSRRQKIPLGAGYQVPLADRIRKAVSIPVMAVGLITEPQQAEDILQAGQADLIALARGFLYNPRWVWHAAQALGGKVSVPIQYCRCEPANARGIFGEVKVGAR